MPNLFKLPTWADKQHVYAVVETRRGSRAKLKYEPKPRTFTLSKPLLAGLTYPYDWGFIPSTAAPDGDHPVDYCAGLGRQFIRSPRNVSVRPHQHESPAIKFLGVVIQ